MTDHTDLIQRLRNWRESGEPPRATQDLCDEAANALEALPAGARAGDGKSLSTQLERAWALAAQFRSHPVSRGIDEIEEAGELLYALAEVAEPSCPNCQGSGEIMVMTSHLGPDDYEHPAPCDHCNGTATLEAAYLGVVKLLEKERAESLKLSGKLYGLRHHQERRDAFLLEVGEDLARWKDPIGYWKDYTARAAARFDAAGFRAWVLANLPDETVIGSGAWWADHLTAWAGRFVKGAIPSPVTADAAEEKTDGTR